VKFKTGSAVSKKKTQSILGKRTTGADRTGKNMLSNQYKGKKKGWPYYLKQSAEGHEEERGRK